MTAKEVIILTVEDEVADQIGGRYICLVDDGEAKSWYIEPTLFDLQKSAPELPIDWPDMERELREEGIFRLE